MVRAQASSVPWHAALRRASTRRRSTFVPPSPYRRSSRFTAGLAVLALFGLSLTFIDAVVVPPSPAAAAITTGPPPSSATLFPTDSAVCDATGATTNNQTSSDMSQHTATYTPSSTTPVPANPCRFAIEWRNTQYGPSGAGIMRRTLFWVYATAGQYIVTGSSELFTQMNGSNASDIVIWNPDGGNFAAPSNLDGVSNATLDAAVDWRCSTSTAAGGRAGGTVNGVAQASRGVISNRAEELAGAGSVNNSTPAGYAPCYYQAPTTGFYAVAFYGPQGADASVDPGDANGSGIIGAVNGQVQSLPTTTTVNAPAGAAHDSAGNVYVANTSAGNILKIAPDGTISVFATGITNPTAITLTESAGVPTLYVVTSSTTSPIYQVSSVGTVTSWSTPGGATVLNAPQGITTDGTYLYIASTGQTTGTSAAIVRVQLSNKTATNLVSRTTFGGIAADGIAWDAAHTRLLVTAGTNSGIRAVSTGGAVSTMTTTGVTWNAPVGIAFDASGNAYVANTGANSIIKLTYVNATTLTPTTVTTGSPVNGAKGITINTDGYPYLGNTSGNNILRIGPTTWSQVTTGNATRAWDIEVRDTASSTQSVAGRVFTYALAAITDGNPKPVNITYWVTTRDGYRYRVSTNGFDPNGFVLFGNNQGFLNSDGTQLDHDILGGPINGSNLQEINNPQGGTTVQPPTYTIGFDGALDPAVETLLGVPVQTINPSLVPGSLSYDGQVVDDQSYSGQGGTFHIAAAALGEVQIVVSQDGVNYDPTNPRNATIRYTIQSNQVTTDTNHPIDIPIIWNGMANDGTSFPPFSAAHPYSTRATLQGGPYHLPMIDVESQIFGSPTITLENPPDVTGDNVGDCPQYTDPSGDTLGHGRSCTQAFFNDMGYTTADGTKVGRGTGTTSASTGNALTNFQNNDTSYICTTSTGTNGGTLGTEWSYGLAPGSSWTPKYQSDPYFGFDSNAERLIRAFGSSATHNNNYPCNSSNPATGNGSTLGDAAGLDLWTFYPSLVLNANVVVIQAPLAAVNDGTYQLAATDAQASSTTPIAVTGCGTDTTNMPSVATPATGGANTCLLSNDTYPGNGDTANQPVDPGQSGAHVQCLVATNAAGTSFGTSGSIYDASGNAVGTITITGTAYGSDPCAYSYSFNSTIGSGSYTARYQVSDSLAGSSGQSATAQITFGIGGVAVDDYATTTTGGTAVSGNVTSNDLCMADSAGTVNWVNTNTASVTPTTYSYSPWVSLPAASPDLAPDLSAIGTITPGDNASDTDNSTTTTAGSDANLVNVSGTWAYTPSATYSGVFSRQYRINVNFGVYVVDTQNDAIRKVSSGGVVSTLVGTGVPGDGDSNILYNAPAGAVTDSTGNVYIADTANNKIKKITPAGVVSVFAGPADGTTTAGTTNGTGTAARFNGPTGLAIDSSGNLYVSDTGNHLIRKITPAGVVSTFAGVAGSNQYRNGGLGTNRFTSPRGIVVDGSNNVYVADSNVIRKITSGGTASTLAGAAATGGARPPATSGTTDSNTSASVQFNASGGLAIDPTGTYLYVADTGNSRIRRVTLSSGATTTFAGPNTATLTTGTADGTGAGTGGGNPTFNAPQDLGIDSSGNLYVADTGNNRVRKITTAQVVTTWAGPNTATLTTGDRDGSGAGTAGSNPLFSGPQAIAVDGSGNIYLADTANNKIRKITSAAVVTTFSGPSAGTTTSGDASGPAFNVPSGAVIDSQGNLFVTDSGNNKIKKITPAGVVSVFAGPAVGDQSTGTTDATGTAARFNNPTGIAIDSSDNLYVTDTGNNRIRMITPAGVVSTLAGSTAGYSNASGASAQFRAPQGIALASDGNLYVADTGNNNIRKVTLAGAVTLLAGPNTSPNTNPGTTNGSGTSARFSGPTGISADNAGNLYVADTTNNRIRAIVISSATVSTLAGSSAGYVNSNTPTSVRFRTPQGVTVDPSTGNVYVADTGNHNLRAVTSAGATTLFAGGNSTTPSTNQGFEDGSGTNAMFDGPAGIVFNPNGNCDRASATLHITVTPVAISDNETPAAANAVQTCSVTWTAQPGNLSFTPPNYVSTGSTDYAPTNRCNPLANDHGRSSTGSQIDTALLDYTLSFGPGQTSFTNNCTGGSYPTTTVGCFTMAANGTWSFTPPTNWSGAVHVNYAATGAGGDTNRTVMTLHVTPVAVNDSVTGQTGDTSAGHPASALAGNVVAGTITSGTGTGGVDVGTGLSFVSWGTQVVTPGGASSPTPVGTLTLGAGGGYSYTPESGWYGTIVVPYTIKDSTGQTASATLTITVTPPITVGIEKMGISANQWVDMSGSEWAVYKDASLSSGNQVAAGDIVAGGTGRWSINWLVAGADYWLVETKAMTGFQLLAGSVQFHVASDGSVTLASGATTCPSPTDLTVSLTACVIPPISGNPARVVVRDMTSIVLPKAGATGTESFLWTGLGLFALAGLLTLALLVPRRRRGGRHSRYQDFA